MQLYITEEDRLFGRALVELGVAKPEEVAAALADQARRMGEGQTVRLRQLLLDRGHASIPSVEEVLSSSPRTVLVCPACGKSFEGLSRGLAAPPPCPACGGGLFVAGESDSRVTGVPQRDTGTLAPVEPRHAPPAPPAPGPPRRMGPYELIEPIGRGGMGTVYRARHERLGTTCAVKVLAGGAFAQPASVVRFRREASAVARMGKHPHIVSVFDLGEQDGVCYYAMELVEGTSLRQVLLERRLPFPEAATLLEKTARALHFAHAHGVIHRDVKPENILVRADGEPQVADFGLALDTPTDGTTPRLTQAGEVFGTPNYMAPEQVRGGLATTDARTDVYALGAVLYEMLTGRLAFEGESAHEVHQRILSGELVAPRAIRADVPRDLETVCMKCLSGDADRRYQTAEALAEDLALWRAGEPIRARPEGGWTKVRRRVRRHRAVALLGGAVLVALAVAGGVTWRAHRDRLAQERDRQELIASSLSELTRRGGDLIEAASAWRASGDLPRCRLLIDRLRGPIEELRRRDADLLASWYYEGWLERIAGRPDAAEAAHSRAIELGRRPTVAESSRELLPLAYYERGMIRAQRWRRLLADRRLELLRSRGAGLPLGLAPPEPARAEVEEAFPEVGELRREASKDLRSAMSLGFSKEAARAHAASGVCVLLEGGDPAVAQGELDQAVANDWHLVEVYSTQAALAEDRQDWEAASGWYRRGHDADRGYVPHLEGLASACMALARLALDRGERDAATSLREEAQTSIVQACRQDPRAATVIALGADRCLDDAEAVSRAGGDPTESLDRALASAEKALLIDPSNRRALAVRVMVFWDRARRAGDQAGEHLARMIEAADALAKVAPDSPQAVIDAALAHELLGDIARDAVRDPGREYGLAVAGYERAMKLDPRSLAAAVNLGNVLGSLGAFQVTQFRDPTATFEKGRAAYARAVEIDPKSAAIPHDLGRLLEVEGKARAAFGKDPSKSYEEAIASYGRALELDPQAADSMIGRGNVWSAIGKWRRDHGKDPSDAFRQARGSLEQAVATDGSMAWGHANLANLLVTIGDWKREKGEDGKAEYEAAVPAFDRAIAIDATIWQAHLGRGMALEGLGRIEDAIASYEEAHKLVGDAVPNVKMCLDRARAKLPKRR